MKTQILVVYDIGNEQLQVRREPEDKTPANTIIEAIQAELNQPTTKEIEREWYKAEKHREEIVDKLINDINDLTLRHKRRDEIDRFTRVLVENLRARIINQQEKILLLQSPSRGDIKTR